MGKRLAGRLNNRSLEFQKFIVFCAPFIQYKEL